MPLTTIWLFDIKLHNFFTLHYLDLNAAKTIFATSFKLHWYENCVVQSLQPPGSLVQTSSHACFHVESA